MRRREFIKGAGAILAGSSVASGMGRAGRKKNQPNIVYIMLDELGYFELSCMGNKYLVTPNIDKMADEGMRFTQALAGSAVCAPTRSVFLTGQHSGHTTIRSNGVGLCLKADDVTIGEVLKGAGYATGGFGKWGVGDRGTTGVPEKHGFDIFYGYYNQVHAHTYYPKYLVRNSELEYLEGNTGDYFEGETYSQDLIFEESKKFIRENKNRPFFCYCPWTPPHGQWGMPEDEPSWALYKDKDFGAGHQKSENDAEKYAAMVNMIDRQIGEIFELLGELGLEEDTIVFVSGDNGGQHYFENEKYPEGVFLPNGGVFRGEKRDLYEGGLRIPMIVRWPGKIEGGVVSDHLWYFADVMPTLAELGGGVVPAGCDGISIVPTLLGERGQAEHEFIYWEYVGSRAVRMGDWKAICPGKRGNKQIRKTDENGRLLEIIYEWSKKPWELYDLSKDVGERNNVADDHPKILSKMKAFAEGEHTANYQGKTLDAALAYGKSYKAP